MTGPMISSDSWSSLSRPRVGEHLNPIARPTHFKSILTQFIAQWLHTVDDRPFGISYPKQWDAGRASGFLST